MATACECFRQLQDSCPTHSALDALQTPCLDGRAVLPAPSYPTPVRACPELSHAHAQLWLKNDGLSHPIYGGSKVRKAERLVAEAVRRGAKRVLSFGAAGSHHLLTLTLFARAAGLRSAALVFPQPRTPHVVDTLRAALGLGLELQPVQHAALVPWLVPRVLRRGDYLIAPGGSNAIGTQTCADAVDELSGQIEAGELPQPDLLVVALGSGGTCAGLAAGIVRRGLPCRVLGVQVVAGFGPRVATKYLATEVLRLSGAAARRRALRAQLSFDATQLGKGYGAASPAGNRATAIARELGLELDQTYTAKAFARVLELLRTVSSSEAARLGRPQRILYWHTLSATALEPLLHAAPSEHELPPVVRRLFR
ncbi:MAG TPA: pyridoxal-phosphate dependent enzyme [Polyangiaceae bacterium]|nr:pyridoxal-phosphate dependent enzyme [Polyangiaceae bacterium]